MTVLTVLQLMASMQLQPAPTCAWLRVSAAGSTGWGNWPSATDGSKSCIARTKTMWGVSQSDGSLLVTGDGQEGDSEGEILFGLDWEFSTRTARVWNKAVWKDSWTKGISPFPVFRVSVSQVCWVLLKETRGCSSGQRWRLWLTPGSPTRSSPCPSSAPGATLCSVNSLLDRDYN